MNQKFVSAALIVGAWVIAVPAFADCPGPFLRDVKRSYENAKSAEKAGNKEAALYSYHASVGTVCEGANPYETDAVKRATPLALELGAAAEKSGDFAKAAQLYDAGGQFAAADRAYLQVVRANQDGPSMYQSALEYYRNRAEDSAFAANNAGVLKIVGPYKLDPKYLAEVKAMPAKAVERLTQREATQFNEQYLQEYVKLIQSRTDDAMDLNAIQRVAAAQQALMQKWKSEDLIKDARTTLDNLRMWGVTSSDAQFGKMVGSKVAQLAEQHANLLRTKYNGAPKLLADAMDYYRLLGSESPKVGPSVASVRSQALKLGDEANSKQRLQLAAEYYDIAGASDKEQAARDRMQQVAMQKMQPQMEAAQKQAEAMAAQFGDPAKVEEMRKNAEAMRKALQDQQAASSGSGAKAANKKSAEDLEKELGL
jgi:hypothetical protein